MLQKSCISIWKALKNIRKTKLDSSFMPQGEYLEVGFLYHTKQAMLSIGINKQSCAKNQLHFSIMIIKLKQCYTSKKILEM